MNLRPALLKLVLYITQSDWYGIVVLKLQPVKLSAST